MTRRRVATLALLGSAVLTATACATDATPDRLHVGRVSSQPCDRPTARSGWAVEISPGRYLTAAHVVDGPVRRASVDGRDVRVLVVDAAADLAVLTTASGAPAGDPITTAGAAPGDRVTVRAGGGRPIATVVERLVVLEVDDVSARTTSRRASLVLRGAVDEGTSGAPVLDAAGRLVGVVTLVDRDDDLTYATARPDLDDVIARAAPDASTTSLLDPALTCS